MASASPKFRPHLGSAYPTTMHYETNHHHHASSTSHYSPKSPHRKDKFEPVVARPPLPLRSDHRGVSATTTTTAATTTRPLSLESYPKKEPDNTTIIRGAQIIRKQFLERARSQQATRNNRMQGKKTVEPEPDRLFASQNEAVLQDLLRTQPMQPSTVKNHVDNAPFLDYPWSLDKLTGTDPWSLREIAFDPTSVTIMPTSPKHTQISPRHVAVEHWEPSYHGNDRLAHHVAGVKVRDRQAFTEPCFQGLRPPPPARDKLPQHVKDKATAEKYDLGKQRYERDTNSSIPTDTSDINAWTTMDESSPWANLAESVLDESMMTGPNPIKDKETKGAKQTNVAATDVGNRHVRFHDSSGIVSGSNNNQSYISATDSSALGINAKDLEDFLEAVSLDDEDFEKLLQAKENDAVGGDRHRRHDTNRNNNVEVRDDLIQSAIKRQAMAVARVPAVPVAKGNSRGRLRRAYSGGKNRPKSRSRSGGRVRRVSRHSSLRNDLLCGIESECKAIDPEEADSLDELAEAWACHPTNASENPDATSNSLMDDAWNCNHGKTIMTKNPSIHHLSLMTDTWARHYTEMMMNAATPDQPSRRKKRPVKKQVQKKERAVLFDIQQQVQRQLGASPKSEFPPFTTSNAVVLTKEDRFGILSPISNEYRHLQRTDRAFEHAMNAGGLWQSLVGCHVRFPKNWWGGNYRTAPLGCRPNLEGTSTNKWAYYDRHRVKGNKFLNRCVTQRDEPGQLLLHVIVRDFMTSTPILDIAIGCFHPNAKSVRLTPQANPRNEQCRDLWLAIRFRTEDMISVIDPSFCADKMGPPTKTPLGDSKRRVSNANVRAIFGESPPLRTVFALESDIYEEIASIGDSSHCGPADTLLRKYVFHRYQPEHQQISFKRTDPVMV